MLQEIKILTEIYKYLTKHNAVQLFTNPEKTI